MRPSSGETACVIGLGLVGQLVVRLLVAAGVRVVGIDTVEERCRLAEAAGAVSCAAPDDEGAAYIEQVIRTATGGLGADHVFLAAGGDTNGPVELAARLVRDRARVVDIGKTRLDLPWNAYYEKELDVRFSRSYGPGRYDDRYELDGIDYPAGYVRWTERRNLGCFLDLLDVGLARGAPRSSPPRAPSRTPPTVYDAAAHRCPCAGWASCSSTPRPEPGTEGTGREPARAERPAGAVGRGRRPGRPRVRRCGSASSGPATTRPRCCCRTSRSTPGATLARVATTRSLSAVNAQRTFGFESVTTDADEVLADPAIDAVFVVTRHHSHAAFVCRALEHGKAVFVEKPLALTRAEVDGILDVVERTGNDRIMVGFNRRFAPLLVGMRERFGTAGTPVSARYLVNAGRMAAGSWYLDEQLEGSRFLGEGGHFIDTLSWWVGHDPVEVSAVGTPDGSGLQATLRYRRRLARRRSPTPPTATPGCPRRPSTSRAAVGTPGWTTSPGRRCGPAAAATPSGRSPARTRASGPSSTPSSRRSGSVPRCRSASSRSSPRPARRSRWARASSRARPVVP